MWLLSQLPLAALRLARIRAITHSMWNMHMSVQMNPAFVNMYMSRVVRSHCRPGVMALLSIIMEIDGSQTGQPGVRRGDWTLIEQVNVVTRLQLP